MSVGSRLCSSLISSLDSTGYGGCQFFVCVQRSDSSGIISVGSILLLNSAGGLEESREKRVILLFCVIVVSRSRR